MTDERTNAQISAAIAARLFPSTDGGQSRYLLRRFASEHNAALGLVVPKMRERGWYFSMVDNVYIPNGRPQEPERRTVVEFNLIADFRVKGAVAVPYGQEPRAICLAALAALDAEKHKDD